MTPPDPTNGPPLDDEQRTRTKALREARAILGRSTLGGSSLPPEVTVPDLVALAGWILDGSLMILADLVDRNGRALDDDDPEDTGGRITDAWLDGTRWLSTSTRDGVWVAPMGTTTDPPDEPWLRWDDARTHFHPTETDNPDQWKVTPVPARKDPPPFAESTVDLPPED